MNLRKKKTLLAEHPAKEPDLVPTGKLVRSLWSRIWWRKGIHATGRFSILGVIRLRGADLGELAPDNRIDRSPYNIDGSIEEEQVDAVDMPAGGAHVCGLTIA